MSERRGRAATVALGTLLLLMATASAKTSDTRTDAARWRVVGAAADGSEIAALVTHPAPIDGWDRVALVRVRTADGAVSGRLELVPAPRRAALAKRGDYDLLSFERERARRRYLSALLTGGWTSCRPLALDPREDDAQVAHPDGPLTLRIAQEDTAARVEAVSGDRAPVVLAEVALPDLRPSDWEHVPAQLERVVDAFLCGPANALVVVVETADPLQPELRPAQFLLVGGSAASAELESGTK